MVPRITHLMSEAFLASYPDIGELSTGWGFMYIEIDSGLSTSIQIEPEVRSIVITMATTNTSSSNMNRPVVSMYFYSDTTPKATALALNRSSLSTLVFRASKFSFSTGSVNGRVDTEIVFSNSGDYLDISSSQIGSSSDTFGFHLLLLPFELTMY